MLSHDAKLGGHFNQRHFRVRLIAVARQLQTVLGVFSKFLWRRHWLPKRYRLACSSQYMRLHIGMTSLLNDPEHWRGRAEEARNICGTAI